MNTSVVSYWRGYMEILWWLSSIKHHLFWKGKVHPPVESFCTKKNIYVSNHSGIQVSMDRQTFTTAADSVLTGPSSSFNLASYLIIWQYSRLKLIGQTQSTYIVFNWEKPYCLHIMLLSLPVSPGCRSWLRNRHVAMSWRGGRPVDMTRVTRNVCRPACKM